MKISHLNYQHFYMSQIIHIEPIQMLHITFTILKHT
jgi:hypothetical protein